MCCYKLETLVVQEALNPCLLLRLTVQVGKHWRLHQLHLHYELVCKLKVDVLAQEGCRTARALSFGSWVLVVAMALALSECSRLENINRCPQSLKLLGMNLQARL